MASELERLEAAHVITNWVWEAERLTGAGER